MKIIITGANGFVGQNLTRYLVAAGLEVSPLSLRNLWTLPKGSGAIIHLAGKAHDTANTSSDEEYFRVNRDLTIKLFNDFLKSDISDFIYFSSVKATADTVIGNLDEEHLSDPRTPYGKSKLEAENYLLSMQLPDGKRLFIVRPCMIHGPGNKGNLNLLFKVVEMGMPWPLAAFDNKRSFLSIDNLNFLISKILENKDVSSGIYNFADDKSLSTNDLVSIIANSIGKKPILWRINTNLISSFANFGNILKLPLNTERLKKLTESYVVSNAKIKRAIGISRLPIQAEEGLKRTIVSFININEK